MSNTQVQQAFRRAKTETPRVVILCYRKVSTVRDLVRCGGQGPDSALSLFQSTISDYLGRQMPVLHFAHHLSTPGTSSGQRK